MKNIFKDVEHGIESGSKSIGHVFSSAGNTIKGSVSDVYHDTRSAVSYTGKHLIDDVDSLTSMISNPLLWVVVGGVVLVVLTRR